ISLGENSLVAAYQGRGQLKSRPSGTRVVTKSNHFRAYFLYMIRYNNISRPVHAPNAPLRPSLRPPTRPPCQKYGGRDPQPPGLTPLDSNEKEAFSRRNELPRGGLRS